MLDAAIAACCIIDLLASGNAEAVLRASGFTWHLPAAVQGEVQYCRHYDPALPGKTVNVPAAISALLTSGVLTLCDPENQDELDLFTHYAATFRSDGEAMGLALATHRKWVMATDDRKALRVARQAGIAVVSCPELVKAWADAAGPDQCTLNKVLQDIQVLAQFKPNSTMPEFQWWIDELAKT
jgi:hypothetical protein